MRPLTVSGHRIKVDGRNADRIHSYGGYSFAVDRSTSVWMFVFNTGVPKDDPSREDVFDPYTGGYVPKKDDNAITVIWNPRERKKWKGFYLKGDNATVMCVHPEGVPKALNREVRYE